ncbi:MAG: TlpA disulfide reductase family protein [Saprospiraceae bacterium]
MEKGWFDCSYLWKSALKTDTIRNSGRVYFFRSQESPKRYPAFVLQGPKGRWRAYDGSTLYEVQPASQRIVMLPIEDDDKLLSLLNGNSENDLLFKPYLLAGVRPIFEVICSEKYIILKERVRANEEEIIQFTFNDSTKSERKFHFSDPETIHYSLTWKFRASDLSFESYVSHAEFTRSPQHQEVYTSPVYRLPDSSRFEDYFKLDSLIGAGFTLWDAVKKERKKEPELLISYIPDLVLPVLSGDSLSLKAMPGKLVLLDFWYKACAPCLMAIPAVDSLYQTYKANGLSVYSVNVSDKDQEDLKNFVVEREIHNPVLLDFDHKLSGALGTTAYPTFILVDPFSGKIVHMQRGFSTNLRQELSEKIDVFLNQD